MSPTTDNFIHSLVEMSKAFEELPNVQQALAERERSEAMLAKQVQDREESILRLKQELEAKNETIRKVEAERDDAELRFLEADDRTHKALEFIKTSFGSAGALIQSLEPPPAPQSQPQPNPTPPAEPEHHYEPFPKDWDKPTDAHAGSQSGPLPTSPEQSNVSAHVDSGTGTQPQGQSEPGPTSTTTDTVHAATETPIASHTDQPASTTVDDVGYHNEPNVSDGNWSAWEQWATRMNARYGSGNWPQRHATAAQ